MVFHGVSQKCLNASLCFLAELSNAAGGFATHVRACNGEYFHAMDRTHDLTATGWHSSAQQQTIKFNAFISERIALIDADYRRYQATDILFGGKARPCQRVAFFKLFDAVGHGATVAMQIEEYSVIFNG